MCLSPFEPSNVFGKAMHLHMPIGAYQGSAFGPVLFFIFSLGQWPATAHEWSASAEYKDGDFKIRTKVRHN